MQRIAPYDAAWRLRQEGSTSHNQLLVALARHAATFGLGAASGFILHQLLKP